MSRAAARKLVGKLKSASYSMCHFACTTLAKPWSRRKFLQYCNVTVPLETRFDQEREGLTTRRGTEHLYMNLVRGNFANVFVELWEHVCSREFAFTCGYTAGRRSEALVNKEMVLARSLKVYVLDIISELALSDLWCTRQLPQRFWGLRASDEVEAEEAKLQECLASLRETWGAYVKLEEAAQRLAEAEELLVHCRWPYEQWTKEVMIMLCECDFETVPPHAAKQIKDWASGFHSTLLVEQEWNHVREGERQSRSGRFGAASIWHRVFASDLLTDWGRPAMVTNTQGNCAAKEQLPSDMFTVPKKSEDTTLGSDAMQKLVAAKGAFPSMSARNVRLSSLVWAAAEKCQGDVNVLRGAWRSLLQQPGTITKHRERDECQLVCATSRYGFLSMRMRVLRSGPHMKLKPWTPAAEAMVVDLVENIGDWDVMEIKCCPPCWPGWTEEVNHLEFLLATDPQPLLEFSARTCFRGLTKPFLAELMSLLHVPGRRDLKVAMLCTALLKHIFPGASTDDLEEILARRGLPLVQQETLDGGAEFTEAGLEKLAELLGDDVMAEEVADFKEHKTAANKARAHARLEARECLHREAGEPREVHAQDPPEPAAPPAAEAVVRQPIVFPPHRGMTKAEAQEHAPPNTKVKKDASRCHRWQIEGDQLRQSYSKAWGSITRFSENQALLFVLMCAWSDFESTPGNPGCPWSFDDLPMVHAAVGSGSAPSGA